MKLILPFLSICLCLLLFAACGKKEVDTSKLTTYISFQNFQTDNAFDIYSNGEKIISNLRFDSTFAFTKDYAKGLGSLYTLTITKANDPSYVYLNGTQYLQSDRKYNLIIIPADTANRISPDSISYSILTESTYPVFYGDSANVRFFDFSQLLPLTTLVFQQPGLNNGAQLLDSIHITSFARRYYNDQAVTSSYTGYNLLTARNDTLNFFDATYTTNTSANRRLKTTALFLRQHYYTIYLIGNSLAASAGVNALRAVVVMDN